MKMYKAIAIKSEPENKIYRQLLKFAGQYCDRFSLVWKDGGPLNIERVSFESKLNPFLISEKFISKSYSGVKTSVAFYHLNNETIQELGRTGSLYFPKVPGWPENLMIYIEDDVPWLISFSGNRESYIYTDVIAVDIVRKQNPNLKLALEKPKFEIDGERICTLEDFYEEVSEKLIPGANWGRNLDGFNDILWGGFGTPKYGFVIVWRNSDISQEHLGYRETIRQLEVQKKKCHPGHIPRIEKEIAKAIKEEGPTVFDWLVEIIENHEIIDLILD